MFDNDPNNGLTPDEQEQLKQMVEADSEAVIAAENVLDTVGFSPVDGPVPTPVVSIEHSRFDDSDPDLTEVPEEFMENAKASRLKSDIQAQKRAYEEAARLRGRYDISFSYDHADNPDYPYDSTIRYEMGQPHVVEFYGPHGSVSIDVLFLARVLQTAFMNASPPQPVIPQQPYGGVYGQVNYGANVSQRY